ncbi:MAG: DUF4357 domain-containing protein [Tateyamaria sp.]|jgi:hypothetical protein|uniref:DUF4357 domain-containing protein n=1 Tax=Tateyamaria sp. TaxID=1929288 RepID=UPI0032DD4A75
MLVEDGEFIVETGSDAKESWTGPEDHGYAALRKELEANGTVVPQGGKRVFTQDYVFKSPSAAGAIIQGRNTNGTLDWKVEGTSQTYKSWEQSQLEQFTSDEL